MDAPSSAFLEVLNSFGLDRKRGMNSRDEDTLEAQKRSTKGKFVADDIQSSGLDPSKVKACMDFMMSVDPHMPQVNFGYLRHSHERLQEKVQSLLNDLKESDLKIETLSAISRASDNALVEEKAKLAKLNSELRAVEDKLVEFQQNKDCFISKAVLNSQYDFMASEDFKKLLESFGQASFDKGLHDGYKICILDIHAKFPELAEMINARSLNVPPLPRDLPGDSDVGVGLASDKTIEINEEKTNEAVSLKPIE